MAKRIILLIIGFLSIQMSGAENVPLHLDEVPCRPPVKRTPPVVPVVEYEGDMFTVTTPLMVECVPFAICEEDGAVVYSSTNCAASRSHSFTVSTLTPGCSYTVDVTIGSITWTGDFTYTE